MQAVLTNDVGGQMRVPRTHSAGAERSGGHRTVTNEQLCELIETIALRRDRAAFATLFQHFAPRLKAFGMRQGSSPASAEELAQEAMLSVWRKAETFDRSRATASTWVFTIVRNKRIDMFRRENRPEIALDEAPERASEADGPDRMFELEQTGGAVREALSALSADQLSVIQKAFFEDKSHSAIAEELGLPLGTVKSRIRLALGRLRSVIAEDHR